jgi:hypothetical protein
MSHPPETSDLEAQIDALIKRTANRLQQQRDDVTFYTDQVLQPPPSVPVHGKIGDSRSTAGGKP